MKNIKYILFILLIFCLNFTYVTASCSKEELSTLKEEAGKIKITYKHLGAVETDDGISYDQFEVKVKNIPNDFYVSLLNGTLKLTPENNTITETFNSGTWNFSIYSNNCDEEITTIRVKIPRFNMYSLDPLCEGIDGEDFSLCGKYYDYYVSYENFKQRVENYRTTHKINNAKDETKEESGFLGRLLDYIVNFAKEYYIYLIIAFVIVVVFIIILFIIRKRKKRGVLE